MYLSKICTYIITYFWKNLFAIIFRGWSEWWNIKGCATVTYELRRYGEYLSQCESSDCFYCARLPSPDQNIFHSFCIYFDLRYREMFVTWWWYSVSLLCMRRNIYVGTLDNVNCRVKHSHWQYIWCSKSLNVWSRILGLPHTLIFKIYWHRCGPTLFIPQFLHLNISFYTLSEIRYDFYVWNLQTEVKCVKRFLLFLLMV